MKTGKGEERKERKGKEKKGRGKDRNVRIAKTTTAHSSTLSESLTLPI